MRRGRIAMYMDDRIVTERQIEAHGRRVTLRRVINAGGCAYSVILDERGFEVGSAPTEQEAGLVKWWTTSGWRM